MTQTSFSDNVSPQGNRVCSVLLFNCSPPKWTGYRKQPKMALRPSIHFFYQEIDSFHTELSRFPTDPGLLQRNGDDWFKKASELEASMNEIYGYLYERIAFLTR